MKQEGTSLHCRRVYCPGAKRLNNTVARPKAEHIPYCRRFFCSGTKRTSQARPLQESFHSRPPVQYSWSAECRKFSSQWRLFRARSTISQARIVCYIWFSFPAAKSPHSGKNLYNSVGRAKAECVSRCRGVCFFRAQSVKRLYNTICRLEAELLARSRLVFIPGPSFRQARRTCTIQLVG